MLRALGWRGPILLLEGCFEPRDLEPCSRLNLWHAVHRDAQIDWLAAHKTDQPHRVFLKLNSGMNRLGFAPGGFRAAWARLDALPQVDEISLMTHFADADGARRRRARSWRCSSARHARPAGRTLARQQRRDAALRRAQPPAAPTGCGRASWSTAARPTIRVHNAADWGLRRR